MVRPSLETRRPFEPLEAASSTSAREYRHRIWPVFASDMTTPSDLSSATPPAVPAMAPVAGTSRLHARVPSSCTGCWSGLVVVVVLTVLAVSNRACTNGSPADTTIHASNDPHARVTPRLIHLGGACAYAGANLRRLARASSAPASTNATEASKRYGHRSDIAAPGCAAGQRHQQRPIATSPSTAKTMAGMVTSRGCARRNHAQASPAATAVPAIGVQTGKPLTSSGSAGHFGAAPRPRPNRTEAATTTPRAAPKYT